MSENNIMYPNLKLTLSNDPQFGSNKIKEIRNYFIADIKERNYAHQKT